MMIFFYVFIFSIKLARARLLLLKSFNHLTSFDELSIENINTENNNIENINFKLHS